MKYPPSLADAPWLKSTRLQSVMGAVTAAGGEIRVAGGAVRNALMGFPIADVDLATTLLPHDVMQVCKTAGFGVHPTGLEHGTITVVNAGRPFEITTLRRDIETDGRRAVVQFTDDWAEDAKRRDFTINAMYCDADGKIYDFTNGYADILRHQVRFVGAPTDRITEDYLRILRFFRFQAFYGKGAPDSAGLEACAKLKSGLRSISAERLRQEMLKLLVAPRAVPTLKIMAEAGILELIVPYTEDWRVIERLPADGLLRLFVLAERPLDLKERLRLSNDEEARLEAVYAAPPLGPNLREAEQRAMLYELGATCWRDAVLLNWARTRVSLQDTKWQALLDLPHVWPLPKFPVSGRDLLQLGQHAGPGLGHALQSLEDWWVANDFAPSREQLLEHFEKP